VYFCLQVFFAAIIAAAIVLIKQLSRQPGPRFNLIPYHNKDRRFNRALNGGFQRVAIGHKKSRRLHLQTAARGCDYFALLIHSIEH
jgi:hypothetical protein